MSLPLGEIWIMTQPGALDAINDVHDLRWGQPPGGLFSLNDKYQPEGRWFRKLFGYHELRSCL